MESRSHIFAVTFISLIILVASMTNDNNDGDTITFNDQEITPSVSLRGLNRFLAQKLPANYTCDKFPTICRLKGGPGPDCCTKKCVNVKGDRSNCGLCGYKCKYSEICCGGKCVNVLFDQRHCGGCHNKCKKGELCAYGMCSYA